MFVTPRRLRGVVCILFAALVFSGAVFLFLYFRSHEGEQSGRSERSSVILEIKDSQTGRVYGKWPLEEGREFAVEFIHSVNQSPVRETFGIEGRKIRPLSVRFFSFGAGMQSDLEEGLTLSRDGDAMVITGFNASYGELNYIVGTVSDHLLFLGGGVYSLRELCGRNAHISIYLKKKGRR